MPNRPVQSDGAMEERKEGRTSERRLRGKKGERGSEGESRRGERGGGMLVTPASIVAP